MEVCDNVMLHDIQDEFIDFVRSTAYKYDIIFEKKSTGVKLLKHNFIISDIDHYHDTAAILFYVNHENDQYPKYFKIQNIKKIERDQDKFMFVGIYDIVTVRPSLDLIVREKNDDDKFRELSHRLDILEKLFYFSRKPFLPNQSQQKVYPFDYQDMRYQTNS